ncbi:MAG TPA: glycosyltransferase family 39 protein [Usitatibacter sp.]|jgi:4-amino-4-deoxy-L-arabinose transferase-like glycosyltransferase|nr:glycosyltransferase family 39 protein [Usitatibacter sp.]
MTERQEDPTRGRIDFDGSRTPFKTALFLVLVLTWMLPGLVGHDPWKVDEAINFGAVLEMLRGHDWIAFRIAGEPYADKAPLYLWVAAACAKAFGGILALHDAARLATGLFMAATCAFLSAAAKELLGERGARMSVLLFIGCLGLLVRAHEMTSDVAGLPGIAMALYGLALAARRPWLGAALIGAGLGLAFLGDGFLPAGMVIMMLAVLPAASGLWRTRAYAMSLALAAVVALPLLALWPLLLAAHTGTSVGTWLGHALASRWGGPFTAGSALESFYILRILPWYTWPAWPLAAWAVWRSRRTLGARRGVLMPLLAFLAFFLVGSIFGGNHDVDAMPLLLPLAILGVAELDTVPRGAASALDWFGVTTFFLFALLLWIGWAGALTGKPDFAVAWLKREVPDFHYRFDFIAFALAMLLTLIWIVIVARSLRSSRRAIVNWTAGIAMVWMLMMTLGVPLVDQARSYRAVDARLAHEVQGARCIERRNVGDAQRALLDYFQGIRTVRESSPEARECDALLLQAQPSRAPVVEPGWHEVWRGSRPGDRNELFILYRRG